LAPSSPGGGVCGVVMVMHPGVLFSGTVRRNLRLGLGWMGHSHRAARAVVEKAAEELLITDLLDRNVRTLSAGQRQRVNLARAMVLRQSQWALLLDEPLSAVDVNTRLRLRKELKRINTELNVPVLHITHDPQEAITLGDRICVMLDSRIRQVGSAAELFHEPCEPDVARFLGMRNILAVSEVKSGACFVDGRQTSFGRGVREQCEESVHVPGGGDRASWLAAGGAGCLRGDEPYGVDYVSLFQGIANRRRRGGLYYLQEFRGSLPLTGRGGQEPFGGKSEYS